MLQIRHNRKFYGEIAVYIIKSKLESDILRYELKLGGAQMTLKLSTADKCKCDQDSTLSMRYMPTCRYLYLWPKICLTDIECLIIRTILPFNYIRPRLWWPFCNRLGVARSSLRQLALLSAVLYLLASMQCTYYCPHLV